MLRPRFAEMLAPALFLVLGCQGRPSEPPLPSERLPSERMDLERARAEGSESRTWIGASTALTALLQTRSDTRTTSFDAVIHDLAKLLCPEIDPAQLDWTYPAEGIPAGALVGCGGVIMKDGSFHAFTLSPWGARAIAEQPAFDPE